ncbi:MAG: hypothetical protein R3194_08440 [Limnobacter sp.]|nr:hypothetical protein [Limnobacter sp.]
MSLLQSAVMGVLSKVLQTADGALSMVRRYPKHARFDLVFTGDNGDQIEGHFDADQATLKELDAQIRNNRYRKRPQVLKVSPSSLELHELASDPHGLGITHSVVDEFVPVVIEVHSTGFAHSEGTHEIQIQVSERPGLYRAYFDLRRV